MHAQRFYHLHRPLFFHLLISVIHTARDIKREQERTTRHSCFFSPSSPLASRLSFSQRINRRLPLRPYFHGRRRVASSRELPAREETDFKERYLWHSRNEMHDASPGKRSSHHIGHWGRIVNWLSMRLHRWCRATARIRGSEKFARMREREKEYELSDRKNTNYTKSCISKIIFENHFRTAFSRNRVDTDASFYHGLQRTILILPVQRVIFYVLY